MSKELKAFKKLREQNDFLKERNIPKEFRYDDELDIVETALKRLEKLEGITCKKPKDADEILDFLLIRNKALEIIKKKNVDLLFLKSSRSLNDYNDHCSNELIWIKLTQEEFDLLKEVLLCQ